MPELHLQICLSPFRQNPVIGTAGILSWLHLYSFFFCLDCILIGSQNQQENLVLSWILFLLLIEDHPCTRGSGYSSHSWRSVL